MKVTITHTYSIQDTYDAPDGMSKAELTQWAIDKSGEMDKDSGYCEWDGTFIVDENDEELFSV